ncbi:MAG: hypothetical protein ACOH5I_01005 [Oligoflexus sp.]
MRAISAFVLTVISLAVFSLAKPQIDLRLKRIKQAQHQYQQAIIKTYQSLTTVAYEILDDSNLRQNLEWDLNHSNAGILRRYIYPGRISFIRVVTADCRLLSHTEGGVINGSPCLNTPIASLTKPEFSWSEHLEKALVTLHMPFQVKNLTYVLLLGTYLDHAWFHHHPHMDQLRSSVDLEILPAKRATKGLLLQEEGFSNHNKSYQANLYTQDWLLNFMPFLMRIKSKSMDQAVLYLAVLTLLLLAAVIILLRRQEFKLLQSLTEFQSWVGNLGSGSEGQQKSIDSSTDPKSYLLKIREDIKRIHDFHFNRDRSLQAIIDQQKNDYDKIQKDLLDLQQKYYLAKQTETLYSQFQQTSHGFIKLQSELYEQTENLADAISHGISQQVHGLYKIIEKWERELAVMNPRKFIRTLAERPSTIRGETTELEADVASITEIGKHLSHTSLHIAIEVQKILQQINQSLQVALHLGAMEHTDNRRGQQLITMIQQAQNLVPMSQDIPDHQFINLVEAKLSVQHIEIPQSIWVSILYHLYMTLIEVARPFQAPKISIQSRVRQREQQIALVLTIDELPDHGELASKSERAQSHFELVKQLLRPYHMQVIELPQVHHSFSLALTWLEEKINLVDPDQRRIQGASKDLNF